MLDKKYAKDISHTLSYSFAYFLYICTKYISHKHKNLMEVSKSQMVGVFNAVSEQFETAKVTVTVKKDALKYKEHFSVLFNAVNRATAKNIRPVTAKVLLYLCSIVDYGNVIDRSSKEIGEDLGYSTRNIEIAIKELMGYKILFKKSNPQDGRRFLLVINPLQSWKGTVLDRNIAIDNFNYEDKDQLKIPFPELNPPAKLEEVFTQDEAINNFESESLIIPPAQCD